MKHYSKRLSVKLKIGNKKNKNIRGSRLYHLFIKLSMWHRNERYFCVKIRLDPLQVF